MAITPEITRFKVIGQPINPFISIADDFVSFIGCYSELIHGEYQIGSDDSGAISLWADVHKDQRIYLENPEPTIPEPKSNRGRKPTKLKAQTDPIRALEWAARQPEGTYAVIPIRESTQGTLSAYILHQRVGVLGW